MDLKPVGNLMLAAASVVAVVFGLFGSVLQEFAPPAKTIGPILCTGVASLASLIILLTAVLAMPALVTIRQRRWVVAISLAIGSVSFYSLFRYAESLNVYAYTCPKDDPSRELASKRHIRGEFTPLGEEITKQMTVEAAIKSVGGCRMNRDHQLLWTEHSQKATEMRLVGHYVASIAMLNVALFIAAVAVRNIRSSKAREAAKRRARPS
jgi:hypothetical protein